MMLKNINPSVSLRRRVSEEDKMAASEGTADDSLYPIAVLIDELRNEDVQVCATWKVRSSRYPFIAAEKCREIRGMCEKILVNWDGVALPN